MPKAPYISYTHSHSPWADAFAFCLLYIFTENLYPVINFRLCFWHDAKNCSSDLFMRYHFIQKPLYTALHTTQHIFTLFTTISLATNGNIFQLRKHVCLKQINTDTKEDRLCGWIVLCVRSKCLKLLLRGFAFCPTVCFRWCGFEWHSCALPG